MFYCIKHLCPVYICSSVETYCRCEACSLHFLWCHSQPVELNSLIPSCLWLIVFCFNDEGLKLFCTNSRPSEYSTDCFFQFGSCTFGSAQVQNIKRLHTIPVTRLLKQAPSRKIHLPKDASLCTSWLLKAFPKKTVNWDTVLIPICIKINETTSQSSTFQSVPHYTAKATIPFCLGNTLSSMAELPFTRGGTCIGVVALPCFSGCFFHRNTTTGKNASRNKRGELYVHIPEVRNLVNSSSEFLNWQ